MKELSQIISNESGTLSIRPHKGGIWLVVEDGQDICSIALSQEEIITLWDEAFFNMTWASNPAIHVLATTKIPATHSAGQHQGEVVPQIWTYEHTLAGGQPARAFVWMQGHSYASFARPEIQNMLLRAIAWAGKHPVDELVDYQPPPVAHRPAPAGTGL